MKRLVKPVAIIRLYPEEHSDLYARVRIWRTLRDFRAARPDLKSAGGACTGHQWYSFREGKRRKLPIFCTVELVQGRMGAGVLAHELCHATIQWAHRVGMQGEAVLAPPTWGLSHSVVPEAIGTGMQLPRDCGEERFCYALGEMYRQINIRCAERGYYKRRRK